MPYQPSKNADPNATTVRAPDEPSLTDDDDAVTSDALLREAARIVDLPHAPRGPLEELKKGELLGRYLIDSTLGRGGMGVVYKAQDTKLGRMIALKVLSTGGKDPRGRFLREAKSAAAVEHKNIATIHDYGEDEGRLFIAMELVRGKSLDKLLRGAVLPVFEALRIAHEIARGLATAHATGIIHRDIKPGNVMISEEGDIKLLDFGLAKRADREELAPPTPSHEHFTTAEKSVIGTPGYMSPEQVKGERVDARTDVFSFGVMFYEILTGRRPFGGRSAAEINIALVRDEPEPPSLLNPSTPAAIEALVMKCLRKDPAERYLDAGELLHELEAELTAAPAPTAPPRAKKEIGRASRARSPWVWGLLGIFFAGLSIAWFAMNRATSNTASADPSGSPESPATVAPQSSDAARASIVETAPSASGIPASRESDNAIQPPPPQTAPLGSDSGIPLPPPPPTVIARPAGQAGAAPSQVIKPNPAPKPSATPTPAIPSGGY